jgi:acyl-coenzyme A synthetase/AMP-(fatty) acid ligase
VERQRDIAMLRERWYELGFYGSLTLSEAMRQGAAEHLDAQMIFHGDERPARASLRDLFDQSCRLAAGLRRLGLREGDVIAVQVPNWLEGAVTYPAAMHLGLTIVPIIHIYGPAEVGFIVRQSGAKALVVPERWRSIDFVERVGALGDTPDLEHIIMISDGPAPIGHRWADLLDDTVLEPFRGDPDDVCLLVYTSGTTAEPKGVQHTHNTLLAEIRSLEGFLYSGERSVNLGAFPAGHIAGVLALLRMFVFGTTTIMLDTWNPADAARLVEEHRVTSTAGPPIFLRTMLDQAEALGTDVTSISNYMVGGASVPPSLVAEADARGITVYRGYGSSEHPVVSTGVPTDPLDKRANTDGRLTPGNEIRFVDDEGHDVPTGTDGEIAVRGPEQFVGYRNAALDTEAFLDGGWFLTGDIGRMDADGYLTITDRKKDVIIRGGENIASKEVEDILARLPGVVEAAVVGMPDDTYGEKVCAYLLLRDGVTITLADVQEHFIGQGVARQKTPERIVVVDELPRSMSGKVKKFELRDSLRHPT